MESITTTMECETLPSTSSLSAGSVRQPLPKAQVFILPKHRPGAFPPSTSPTSSPTSSAETVSPRTQSALPELLRGRVRLLDVPRFDVDHALSAPSSPSVPSAAAAVLLAPASATKRKSLILGDMSPTQTMSVHSMQLGVVHTRTGQELEQVTAIAGTVASHYAYDDFMATKKKKKSLWKRFTGRVKGVAGSFYASSPPPTPPFTPK